MVKIFVAGPVNAVPRVKNLMPSFDEIGHREPEFKELYNKVRANLFKLFRAKDDDFNLAIIGGSGTSAMESTLSSVVEKPLIISNGAFGERMSDICRAYKISHYYLKLKWGEYPDLQKIEALLKKYPDITDVCMIYMETSTGMLNPLHKVGLLCKEYDKTYIVDAVCAIAGERLDMEEDNIDFCFVSSNKGIGGPPVVGIVCCRKSKLKKLVKRNYYLDLSKYLEYGEIGQTPFTPPIPLFYLMNETLEDLFMEGLDSKIERYKKNTELLRKELSRMGLTFKLKNHMAHCMTNVNIPDGFTFKYIHDELKKRGLLIYPGKSELNGKIMHIATMGNINENDVRDFTRTLNKILQGGKNG